MALVEDTGAAAVPLPPGRPGRLAGPGPRREPDAATAAEAACAGPTVDSDDHMRRLALEAAEPGLAQEMSTMLFGETLAEVAAMCGADAGELPLPALARRLAEEVVDLVWTPLGGCIPLLRHCLEEDVRAKLQLFWRCVVALCMMPLPHLAALSLRKRQFFDNLDALLPPADAAPAAARRAHLRLNLPIFSMTARLPSEGGRSGPATAGASPPAPAAPAAAVVEARPAAAAERPRPLAAGEEQQVGPRGDEHERLDKVTTAARHTHDVGYKRWERFNVDQALHELDAGDGRASRTVKVDVSKMAESQEGVDYDDPVKALDQAIAKLRETPEATEAGGEPVEVQKDAAAKEVPSRATESLESLASEAIVEECGMHAPDVKLLDDTTGSTAAKLAEQYQKWQHFGGSDGDELDDVDDLDDDMEGSGHSKLDLDAIKGPKEEVAKIHRHWRREQKEREVGVRKDKRSAAQQLQAERRAAREPELPAGPIIHRPCEYRPPSDPSAAAAQALARDYGKWKNFDADSVILDMDNEGTTEDGTALRCNTSKHSAVLNCENYTKDREEYDLDQEIEEQIGGLKKTLAQRVKDAAGCKLEGNSLMREGRFQDACEAYQKGLEVMELCTQASVLMADSMEQKQRRLLADLHRNLAAAHLELHQFDAARASCDAALAEAKKLGDGEDEKARYRRAMALFGLGRTSDAQLDTDRLAVLLGEQDPAVRRLRARAHEGQLGGMD